MHEARRNPGGREGVDSGAQALDLLRGARRCRVLRRRQVAERPGDAESPGRAQHFRERKWLSTQYQVFFNDKYFYKDPALSPGARGGL